MGKIIETTIDRFDGGITDDPRSKRSDVAQVVTNFNALSNPHRLIPYRDSETGFVNTNPNDPQNFVVALRTGSTYSMYALAHETGQVYARIFFKDLTTGASNDLDDGNWNETANNTSASGAVSYNLFVYYKKTGLIYGARSSRYIFAYDPTGSAAFADTHADLTAFTNIAQGLVHSKDDILYVPYDNKIAKNDNGTWTTAALTLPSYLAISSIAEYGNFLAIACVNTNGLGNSVVYLWDRDDSLTTLTEAVDWGSGTLMVLENVDGVLIGISQVGGSSTSISGVPNGSARFNDRVIFRYLSGSQAIKFKELVTGSATTQLPMAKQKIDNRLYFMLSTSLYGATREGVWSVGRTPGGEFTVVHERTPNNDTALTSGVLKNFFFVGDYLFQVFVTSGTYTITKTNDTASYTATSIYESKIINDGDSSLKKKLIGISVMTEYLPSAGSIVLKYKKDQDTSFTTIFTETTDNSISHSAINIESSGVNLPEYKEITFRIESTGGAVPTAYSWKSEITDKRPY